MLIRFTIENFFSFGERKEFTMIPNHRLGTLLHHKYRENDFEILKMASVYGANGAGKSNLVKSLELLQDFVMGKVSLLKLNQTKFKFNQEKNNNSQIAVINFIQDSIPFYYAIELKNNRVATEELYITGLNKDDNELIFERVTDKDNITKITFSEEFEKDEKSQVLKSVLLEDFVKPNTPILELLSKRDNQFLRKVRIAYEWFEQTLQVLSPSSIVGNLAHMIDVDENLKEYAIDLMSSFNLGVTNLVSDKQDIHDFFGADDSKEVERIIKFLTDSPERILTMTINQGGQINIVNENGNIVVKSLRVGHCGNDNKEVLFELNEESDGTVRLLDFVPAFLRVVSDKRVFVIDEIERSIHPLLIKELIQKFSLDENTKGQLIFTTHETNLLDQEFFRKDEIWFTEKNKDGATDLYSLNDFKEHKTIDIKKGYLSGRYGSIPFLGNLKDLNWHKNDSSI